MQHYRQLNFSLLADLALGLLIQQGQIPFPEATEGDPGNEPADVVQSLADALVLCLEAVHSLTTMPGNRNLCGDAGVKALVEAYQMRIQGTSPQPEDEAQ